MGASNTQPTTIVLAVEDKLSNFADTSPKHIIYEILNYLSGKELATVGTVSKLWGRLASDDELWKPLCFVWGTQKLDHQTWKQVYIEMKKEEHDSLIEKQVVENEGILKYSGYACGMRWYPPSPPKRPDVLPKNVVGGFKVHPNSSPELTVDFSVDLKSAASELYDFTVKCQEKKELNDEVTISIAMKRYDQFLKLTTKYPNKVLIPTLDIELIWQSHLIRPYKYEADCQRLYGKIIPHKIVATKLDIQLKERALKETNTLWIENYKEKYCTENLNLPKKRWVVPGPFSSVKSVLPTYFYFDGWKNSTKLKNWENPFSFNSGDVIKDFQWLKYFEEYISNPDQAMVNCKFLTRTIKAYERFLFLATKYPPEKNKDDLVHPTYAIDLIWHTHMIHPVEYKKDCMWLMFTVPDHEPWPEKSSDVMTNAFTKNNQKWNEEYGVDINSEHILGLKSESAWGDY